MRQTTCSSPVTQKPNSHCDADADRIRFDCLDPTAMRFYESVMSQSNGHMGMRGSFEEIYSGDHLQGTYLAGVWYPDKTRVGWWKNGYPDFFGKAINTVNIVGIRVLVDGEELDAAASGAEEFHAGLDLGTAVLTRRMVVKTGSGRVCIESKRFLSMEDRELAAIRYSVTPLDGQAKVVLRPYLDFNVRNEDANYEETFWEPQMGETTPHGGLVTARTAQNRFGQPHFDVCAAMSVTGSSLSGSIHAAASMGYAEQSLAYELEKGQSAQIDKLVAVATSRDTQYVKARARKCVRVAAQQGFDALYSDHCSAMSALLEACGVELEGDASAQQGLRYSLMQLFCTYHGHDSRLNIGPKGFSGEKYGGAAYWDTEGFLIPFYLGAADSSVARSLLMFRYNTLEKAKANAKKLGLAGALYPMVTFDGQECHNEWEITFEEIHRNGAIAHAVYNYVTYTGDTAFLLQYGFEMLLELSRFWASRVHWSERRKSYMLHGVTGPNEYENNVSNNWYTNRIAKWTLDYTASLMETYGRQLRTAFGESEPKHFKEIAERMVLPYDSQRQVFVQHDTFLDKALEPASMIDPAQRPINHHWSWDRILRSCYIKQADVLQGLFFLEDAFSNDTVQCNFDFYEPMTVHESSLSAGVHAVVAAWAQRPEKAWELFMRAVRLDLDNINRDTADGLHITAMSGGWLALVKGFAGMKTADGALCFAPVLPGKLTRYAFAVQYRGRFIRLSVERGGVTLTLQRGEALEVNIYGKAYRLEDTLTVPLSSIKRQRRYRGLIFDLDGVLTDTARLHYEAWRTLAKAEWNFEFTESMNEGFKGVERRTCMRLLARMMGQDMDEAQIIRYADMKNAVYREMIQGMTPDDLMPQARNLLNACREQGLRTAVASASRNTRDILAQTGIAELFDAIVDGNAVSKPKPDPECFTQAAARLGLEPHECLVLEDAQTAIDAAVGAGFACAGIGSKEFTNTLFQLGCIAGLDIRLIP